MAKTFNPNRVGGGTVSLVRAADGTYSLKETGFEQVSSLNMIDLGAVATTTTTKKTDTATDKTGTTLEDQTKQAFVLPKGDSDRDDNTDLLLRSATNVSDSLQTTFDRPNMRDIAGNRVSTFDAEAEDSLEDRTSIADPTERVFGKQTVSDEQKQRQTMLPDVETPQQKLAVTSANVQKGLVDPPGFTNPFKDMLGSKFQTEKGTNVDKGRGSPLGERYRSEVAQGGRPGMLGDTGGSMDRMGSTMPGNLGDTGRSMNQMSGVMSAPADQDLEADAGAKARSDIQTTPAKKTFAQSVNTALKNVVSMSPAFSVIRAIGSVNEAANTENTTALRSGGYVTDFQGKIIGRGDKAVDATTSVFGGMNSRSALGDISKGAANRISTRNSAKTQARISKLSPEKQKAFNDKTKEFEKELLEHNTNRAREREDKSGATGKNKGGFTNPGANSYGPHSGGGGGDSGCFIKGTLITMLDGSKKPVEKVDLGDNVAVGGKVFAVGRFLNTELYDYKGIKVSGSHMVNEDGTWLRVRDTKYGKSLGDDLNTVYVFGSENRRILIDNILFTDYFEVSEQDQLINNEEDFFDNWKSYGDTINEHNVNTLNAS